jgi:uncharacterized membrane protein
MYLSLKVIHLLAVVIFVGNIATGFFWHAHAWRTRNPILLAHTVQGLIRSDRVLTMPSAGLLIIAGIATAVVGGVPMRTGWIGWTIVAFVVAGALFSTRVGPLQKQLYEIANAASGGSAFDESRYADIAARWRAWGAVAVLALAIGLALMVLKPF